MLERRLRWSAGSGCLRGALSTADCAFYGTVSCPTPDPTPAPHLPVLLVQGLESWLGGGYDATLLLLLEDRGSAGAGALGALCEALLARGRTLALAWGGAGRPGGAKRSRDRTPVQAQPVLANCAEHATALLQQATADQADRQHTATTLHVFDPAAGSLCALAVHAVRQLGDADAESLALLLRELATLHRQAHAGARGGSACSRLAVAGQAAFEARPRGGLSAAATLPPPGRRPGPALGRLCCCSQATTWWLLPG